jgi:hypothetical protein
MKTNLINWIRSLFGEPQVRKIAFIDGDQPLPGLLECYEKCVLGTKTDTFFIRVAAEGANPPKIMKKFKDVTSVMLVGYTTGKEVVDKYIGASIQKAIADGYTEITVISGDYDFIDIFKMAMKIDDRANTVKFNMIIPRNSTEKKNVTIPRQNLNISVFKFPFFVT